MRSRLVLALAALLAFVPAFAAAQGARTAYFAIGYDVASTTTTYCVMAGSRGDPWGEPIPNAIRIKTTGSSQTVDAVTAATLPFADLAIGDAIFVRRSSAIEDTDMVWITAKASGDQVTVSEAVDWSTGYEFAWLDLTCGTSVDAGWVTIERFNTVAMTVQYEAGDLGGLDVVWECKDNTSVSGAVQVYPGPASDCGFGTLNTNVCTYTTTGDRQKVEVSGSTFSACRLGLAYRTSDSGTREDVHGIVVGR